MYFRDNFITWGHTPRGQLASLTDAENQTTSYTYEARGAKLTEQYPDHTSGSGQVGYGIVTFVCDAAGRTPRKQDQQGNTVAFPYDLAGRMNREVHPELIPYVPAP